MKKKHSAQSAFLNLPAWICLSALFCATTIFVRANIITVTNTNDSGPGSLRQALADTNDGDTITFTVTGTIMLISGELLVNKSITISGPGAANLIVEGNGNSRVLHISRRIVSISGLTITHGDAGSGNGGGVWNDHGTLTMNACSLTYSHANSGGGILNDHATLTLSNCAVDYNVAIGGGGGIYNNGQDGRATATILDCTVTFNNALGGGGIVNESATLGIVNSIVSNNVAHSLDFETRGSFGGILNDGTLTIVNSTIANNLADFYGGGMSSAGTVMIANSAVINNIAGSGAPGLGGGIDNVGAATITNSTISSNAAGDFKGSPGVGGGIRNFGTLEIANSSFSDNLATNGGGIYNGGAMVALANSILNASANGANIVNNGGTVTSHGYNLSSDDAGGFLNGPGDQINTDPMLGPLQDNGGPTFTHALLPDSPAIDTGDPNFVPPPFYDQRGPDYYRIRNGRIDKGSFEVQAGSTPAPRPTARPAPPPRPRSTPPPRP